MSSYTKKLSVLITVVIALSFAVTNSIAVLSQNSANATRAGGEVLSAKAPMATTTGNHVYITWWSNKTGNDEVMFKASTDGGKTFSNKMNLSNTPKSDSQDAQIAAAGNNVYVTWWERNQTMNEPVMKVSNDNGKTFGEKIMLSNNATTTKPLF
jgi:selenocysteine-specific translation elongation factor